MKTEFEKMLAGEEYNGLAPELMEKRTHAQILCAKYNNSDENWDRSTTIWRLISNESELPTFEGPIHFTYGCNTKFGKNCYANFNLTVLDHGGVTFGDNVMIGPNCTIVTAIHPIKYEERNLKKDEVGNLYDVETAKPVKIGDNCWLGASVTVCPGVTIGNGSVILPGSVVTENVPENSMAGGVPCKVIKAIDNK